MLRYSLYQTQPLLKMDNPSFTLRPTEEGDGPHLKNWLLEKAILRWFPMINEREVEDATRLWMSFAKLGASLTAVCEGVPCGIATLNIYNLKKLAHQCLLSIVVAQGYRGKGIGTALIQALFPLAKKFGIEILHLEVYDGNPAKNLYQRMGFEEYGKHPRFLREEGKYIDKIFMQKYLTDRFSHGGAQ
jgi:RimJ/RimL family protein N-acetyltransferase